MPTVKEVFGTDGPLDDMLEWNDGLWVVETGKPPHRATLADLADWKTMADVGPGSTGYLLWPRRSE